MQRVVVVGCLVGSLLLVSLGVSAQNGPSDAWIPALGSFLIPGLGQVLNDDVGKALIHFGIDVAVWVVGLYASTIIPYIGLLTPAIHLAWAVYSGYDAYTVATEQGFTIGMIENGVSLSYLF
jgi:TM2 domain-containing membrane protein YozV